MNPVKVINTISQLTPGSPSFIAKGKLEFIEVDANPTDNPANGSLLNICNDNDCRLYKPVIVSDVELMDLGDMVFDGVEMAELKNPQGIYFADLQKVLAFPENFSEETIKEIWNGKFKRGDEVYVECEYPTVHGEGVMGVDCAFFIVKLTNSFIKIYSIENN